MKGYVKDSLGHILYKLDLPSDREHKLNLKKGEEFIACDELDKIEVYQEPIIETEEQKKENLIQVKMREIAMKELITEGKLNAEGNLLK